ncbi:hypothetical protein [Streptomyces cylindrosporus]|uniref:Uncharacterized protein n=1 Tax=Streptomyces cylindrosporus TaxID=2927583 RepID=A0ABS9YJW9_9ACTN|nr:hypothetical protein [Streptomyces cylindrosporus]MCI3277489.1 hypothetical protein [Streptomyces cylindrosporus]
MSTERHVNVSLDFVTDADPAAVGARVVEIVVAEVVERLTGASWHGFELDDDQQTEATDA